MTPSVGITETEPQTRGEVAASECAMIPAGRCVQPREPLLLLANGMDRMAPPHREGHPDPCTFDWEDNAFLLNHIQILWPG
jgi:hypothetical protein